MKIDRKSKYIEKAATSLIIIAAISFVLFNLTNNSFIAYFLLFTLVSIAFLVFTFSPYDVVWRKEHSKKSKLIWNIIFKAFFCIIAIGCIYMFVLPYSLDLKSYVSKQYNTTTGYVENITATQNSKGHSYRVKFTVNGTEINFPHISEEEVSYIKSLKQKVEVTVSYLPHSKYGIEIKENL